MDPQTYLLTYQANEAVRSMETERRRQNRERMARDARQRETGRKVRGNGASAHRSH
jgi:hypothetical protein